MQAGVPCEIDGTTAGGGMPTWGGTRLQPIAPSAQAEAASAQMKAKMAVRHRQR